jgi:broad specificity phosphatase PhoE
MFIDETIFPNAHAPQDAPAGNPRKGANETAPATLRKRDASGYVPIPAFRSVMHGDPSMLTPGEIAERRTMRYVVEPPDHRITSWGGVATLEDAQD